MGWEARERAESGGGMRHCMSKTNGGVYLVREGQLSGGPGQLFWSP